MVPWLFNHPVTFNLVEWVGMDARSTAQKEQFVDHLYGALFLQTISFSSLFCLDRKLAVKNIFASV
jgi:hypothetical protein